MVGVFGLVKTEGRCRKGGAVIGCEESFEGVVRHDRESVLGVC